MPPTLTGGVFFGTVLEKHCLLYCPLLNRSALHKAL